MAVDKTIEKLTGAVVEVMEEANGGAKPITIYSLSQIIENMDSETIKAFKDNLAGKFDSILNPKEEKKTTTTSK